MQKYLGLMVFFFIACNSSTGSKIEVNKRDTTTVTTTNKNVADSPKENNSAKYDTIKNQNNFKATGNEPFWSLEINFSKSIHFNTMNGLDITTPIPESVKVAGTNTTRYSTVTDQGELIVEITQQECINDMSGKKSDYSVTIGVKNNSETNYTYYKGCGMYLPHHP